MEEFVGIVDKRLSLFEDGEIYNLKKIINEMFVTFLPFSDMDGFDDSLPQYKLTCYTVYDKEGHVVPFDKNKLIYFSG